VTSVIQFKLNAIKITLDDEQQFCKKLVYDKQQLIAHAVMLEKVKKLKKLLGEKLFRRNQKEICIYEKN